jgi:membrane protease YdiL (CAAX protease family)
MNPANLPEEGPSPSLPPRNRKAAWWCWPLIIFALLPFDTFLFTESAPEETRLIENANPSDLALLKIQARLIIASHKLEPKAAGDSLDQLSETIHGDYMVSALALVESFLESDSVRIEKTIARLVGTDPGSVAVLTKAAVSRGLSDEERETLRRELGWFADLARGPGLENSPQDEQIRMGSLVVLGALGVILTGVAVGLGVGAVLLFLHLRRVQRDPKNNAFVPDPAPRGVLLECFALYLGIMTIGALAGAWFGNGISIGGYAASVVIPLLWVPLRGVRWSDFCQWIGLHRGEGWLREIGCGCVGYLGVLAIASIGVFLTLLLTIIAGWIEGTAGPLGSGGSTVAPEPHPIVGWMYEGTFWTRIACLALASGFAPLFEEIFFRGALYRYFRGKFRFLSSAVFAGIIFAALHPQGFYAIPALASIGVGLSLLREWRDSLIAPMTAHAINNGVLVGVLWWML